MFCELVPPISQSVRRVRPDSWLIGASIICEKNSTIPAGALATWHDENEDNFCLRSIKSTPTEFDHETPVYRSGTSGAVWNIGNIFCKVKSWHEGIEQEETTLQSVKNRFPSIPIPETIYSWIEPEHNRSFAILKSLTGETLTRAWPSLSEEQHQIIAAQVAEYCQMLATWTADSLQTAGGLGILDPLFMARPNQEHPSWKRRTLGPLSLIDAKSYFSPMDLGSQLVFYHADLSPPNILVSKQGKVTGILDWEHAAFYPRFWICTKPHVSAGFGLDGNDEWAWTRAFSQALEERQFQPEIKSFYSWRTSIK